MRRALILGASGSLGQAIAAEMVRRGWRVRGLVRRKPRRGLAEVEYVVGDAMVEADVMSAAKGVGVIVHAVTPPKLRGDSHNAIPMIQASIAAAKSVGARLVLPAGLFNFGPGQTAMITEDSPQNPVSDVGRVKARIETLMEADPDLDSLIVRSGTHLSSSPHGSAFGTVYVTPGKQITALTCLQSRGVGHCWAYVPDLALAIVKLLELPDLATKEKFHFRGYYDADGTGLVTAIQRVVGRKLPVKSFPWWVVWVCAPFSVMFRNLWNLRYLWKQTYDIDNSRLLDRLKQEPSTPIEVALRTILEEFGCIPRSCT